MSGARADLSRFFDLVLEVADPWRLEQARDLAGWSGGESLVVGLCVVAGVARADVVDGDVTFPVTMALNGVAPAGWDDADFDLARALGTCPCDDDVDWCVHTIALALEVIRTAEDAPGLLGVWRQDPNGPPTWGVLPGSDRTDPTGTDAGMPDEPEADPVADTSVAGDPWEAALAVRDQPDRPLGAWIADAFADVHVSDWPRLYKTLTFCLHPDRRHGDDRWLRVLQDTWARLSM